MLSSRVVIHFAMVCFFDPNHGLERHRDIAATGAVRHVVDEKFYNLKVKVDKNNKIKKYSTIQKHFANLTRHENDNWKEVLNSTRLDGKIDNESVDFMTVVNEALNEENKAEGVSDSLREDNVNKCIENFLNTLSNLKENYVLNSSNSTANNELLERYHKNLINNANNEIISAEDDDEDNDLRAPSDTRRIFRGKRTSIKRYPFVVSVHVLGAFMCAGALVAADLVLTAASCLQLAHNNRFYRESPSFLAVRAGSSYYDGAGEALRVLEVYFHPAYEAPTLRNNLAVMRLHRHVQFARREKAVKRIDIDTRAWALPPNTAGITVVGWGAKDASNKIRNSRFNKLSVSVLDFYPLRDCQKIYSKTHVTDKNFCAGFIAQGGGACNRDVGAPGVVDGVLVGVVSFGPTSCGSADSPTVFTKVGFYADWIESIMEQTPATFAARTTARRARATHTVRTLMQPLRKKTTPEPSVELDLQPHYDKQFKEFLEFKGITMKPDNLAEPVCTAETNDCLRSIHKDFERKKKERKKKIINSYPAIKNDGVRKSVESLFELAPSKSYAADMFNFDVDEKSSKATYKKITKNKVKVTAATSNQPVRFEYNFFEDENTSNEINVDIVATHSTKKHKPKLYQNEMSGNDDLVPLQQMLPYNKEEPKLSDNLKIVQQMLPLKPEQQVHSKSREMLTEDINVEKVTKTRVVSLGKQEPDEKPAANGDLLNNLFIPLNDKKSEEEPKLSDYLKIVQQMVPLKPEKQVHSKSREMLTEDINVEKVTNTRVVSLGKQKTDEKAAANGDLLNNLFIPLNDKKSEEEPKLSDYLKIAQQMMPLKPEQQVHSKSREMLTEDINVEKVTNTRVVSLGKQEPDEKAAANGDLLNNLFIPLIDKKSEEEPKLSDYLKIAQQMMPLKPEQQVHSKSREMLTEDINVEKVTNTRVVSLGKQEPDEKPAANGDLLNNLFIPLNDKKSEEELKLSDYLKIAQQMMPLKPEQQVHSKSREMLTEDINVEKVTNTRVVSLGKQEPDEKPAANSDLLNIFFMLRNDKKSEEQATTLESIIFGIENKKNIMHNVNKSEIPEDLTKSKMAEKASNNTLRQIYEIFANEMRNVVG